LTEAHQAVVGLGQKIEEGAYPAELVESVAQAARDALASPVAPEDAEGQATAPREARNKFISDSVKANRVEAERTYAQVREEAATRWPELALQDDTSVRDAAVSYARKNGLEPPPARRAPRRRPALVESDDQAQAAASCEERDRAIFEARQKRGRSWAAIIRMVEDRFPPRLHITSSAGLRKAVERHARRISSQSVS
jgi:hypothetical protein